MAAQPFDFEAHARKLLTDARDLGACMMRVEALAFLQALPHACVDAIVTDPPEFAGDNRDARSFLAWCTLWLSECLRVAKPKAPIAIFTDWRQLPLVTDAIQCGGWVWRGIVPWDKTESARPRMGGFRSQCEYVVWGTAGPLDEREDVGTLPGLVRGAINASGSDKHHQTGKPTPIMQAIVRICPPAGLILDPFAGSGTTGVAALLEGRKFLGCELTEAYYAIACERLEACRRGVELAAYRAGQEALFPLAK